MQLPATSAMSPENDVALEQHQAFAPSSGPRTNKFQKTKLCTAFFATGRCTKRGRCNFAHCEEEVRPLPNLSRTKLCPNLVYSQSCNDRGCTFAHSPEQIRQWHDNNGGLLNSGIAVMLNAEQEENYSGAQEFMLQKGANEAEDEDTDEESEEEGGDKFPSPEEDCDLESESDLFSRQVSGDLNVEISFQRQHTEDPVALCVRQMRVKNTFITIDEDEETAAQKPRRRRARSAPVMKADAPATSKPVLECPRPPKTPLMTAQAADAATEAPLFHASGGPSADSVLGNDVEQALPCLPRPSTPPPRRFHQVERSCGPALSTPSLVASASLSQAGDLASVVPRAGVHDVPAQALAPFKNSPVRIDSDLGDWATMEALPYFAQEPQYLGEPHFIQPRWGPPAPKSKLAWPGSFPLDYSMSRDSLLSSAQPMVMQQLSCHIARQC